MSLDSKFLDNWSFFSSKHFIKGINLGHQPQKLTQTGFFHPFQSPFFLGIRQNLIVIDTQQTSKMLLRAFHIIALILKKKGRVLIINTNPEFFQLSSNFRHFTNQNPCFQADSKNLHQNFYPKISILSKSGVQKSCPKVQSKSPLLENTGKDSNFRKERTSKIENFGQHPKKSLLLQSPKKSSLQKSSYGAQDLNRVFQSTKVETPLVSYVTYKWTGGILTNWKQVSKSVLNFALFSARSTPFLVENDLEFPKFLKIKQCFQGLLYEQNQKMMLAFKQKPDALFLLNPNHNQHILNEAEKLQIPVIALVESNTDLRGITYPIPVNRYSVKFVYFCLKKIIKFSAI